MNVVNNFLNFIVILQFCLLSGCLPETDNNQELNEQTLNKIVHEQFHSLSELREAVFKLYVSAINKDWRSVYLLRDNTLKRLVDEKTFVKTLEKKMSNFSIQKLEFLMIETEINPSGDLTSCRTVVKIVQGPYSREHTAVLNWSKELNDWKTDAIGLRGSPLLR